MTTPSLTLKQQSSNRLELKLWRGQLLKGKSTEGQEDELLGIADNRLLPVAEDDLITPAQSPSKSYDAVDRSHSLYVGQIEIGNVVKPDPLSSTYTLGAIESDSKHNLLSTDPSKSQSTFRPLGINRVDGLNGGENFHPRQ